MKKRLCLLASVVLLMACQQPSKKTAAQKKSPMGLASANIVWPVKGADDATLTVIRQVIASFSSNSEDPGSLVKASVDTFLREYKNNRDDVDTNDMNASWNWTTQTDTRIVWNQYPLLVLENAEYTYTGGAQIKG